MKTVKETTVYHVRYMPKDLDEWWDWREYPTWEQAVESFQEYPARASGARKAHVVTTTTTVTEDTLMYLEAK